MENLGIGSVAISSTCQVELNRARKYQSRNNKLEDSDSDYAEEEEEEEE